MNAFDTKVIREEQNKELPHVFPVTPKLYFRLGVVACDFSSSTGEAKIGDEDSVVYIPSSMPVRVTQ